jgi:hypothetical protein
MAYDYSRLQGTAYRLVSRFGTLVTVARSNSTTNPVTGAVTVLPPTTGEFYAVNPPASKGTIEAFDNRLIGMAAEIGKSVRFFILEPKSSTMEPQANDTLTIDSETFNILGCTPVAPAGRASTIVYKVGVAV